MPDKLAKKRFICSAPIVGKKDASEGQRPRLHDYRTVTVADAADQFVVPRGFDARTRY